MTWLYAAEVALVATCLVLMPRMRRAGEREWRRHQRAVAHAQLLTMMANVAASIDRLAGEFGKLAPAMRRTFDRLDALTYTLYGLERKDRQ